MVKGNYEVQLFFNLALVWVNVGTQNLQQIELFLFCFFKLTYLKYFPLPHQVCNLLQLLALETEMTECHYLFYSGFHMWGYGYVNCMS